MCIYYKNKEGLNYVSEEHVIPAALGGIRKLPIDFVSHEFNNDISKLEQEFIRESVISVPRQFVGPGKRGRLSEKHATKSKIHLISKSDASSDFHLGYSFKNKTVTIPQVILNLKTGGYSFTTEINEAMDLDQLIKDFKTQCEDVSKLKIKRVNDSLLKKDFVLFGIFTGIEENFNAFVFKNPETEFELCLDHVQHIGQILKKETVKNDVYNPICHQSFVMDKEHVRIFGKIAFNFLASQLGIEAVMQPQFDKARNWIAFGAEPIVGYLDLNSGDPLKALRLPAPKDGHYIYVGRTMNTLWARVSLYMLPAFITLSTEYKSPFRPRALFCDWLNRKEYSLDEYYLHTLIQRQAFSNG